ncbi:MAG: RNA polymerase sigma factor [Prevotella sp.]
MPEAGQGGEQLTVETETELLKRVKDGDALAMREMYDRYSGSAMAVALRYVGNRDDACDVLQDSFVKVFTRIREFVPRGEGALKAWVLRITANEALNFLRKSGPVSVTDDLPDVADEEPDVMAVPAEVLNAMIARLPTGYRVVLNLFVFEGLQHKEIAARLGIKENSSASQYHHAKRMLAKMISDYSKHNT